VEYVGEIDQRAKSAFLGDASALLFPIDWPEPSGLSMIEAMACGTPVLAFRCGSVPEIIDPGVTGLIVRTMAEAMRMLPQVLAFDRRTVRQRFEQRFSATRMAEDYIQVYRSVLKRPSLTERAAVVSGLELEKEINSRESSAESSATDQPVVAARGNVLQEPTNGRSASAQAR
jgi:hypothetical protein